MNITIEDIAKEFGATAALHPDLIRGFGVDRHRAGG